MILSTQNRTFVYRATQNSTHLLISTPLNDCGTLVNETEYSLIFWNEIRVDAVIIDNVITRTHNIKFPFSCRYSRREILSLSFTPRSIIIDDEGKLTIRTPYCLFGFKFFLSMLIGTILNICNQSEFSKLKCPSNETDRV